MPDRGDPVVDVALAQLLIASGDIPGGRLEQAMLRWGRSQLLQGFLADMDQSELRSGILEVAGWKASDANLSSEEIEAMWKVAREVLTATMSGRRPGRSPLGLDRLWPDARVRSLVECDDRLTEAVRSTVRPVLVAGGTPHRNHTTIDGGTHHHEVAHPGAKRPSSAWSCPVSCSPPAARHRPAARRPPPPGPVPPRRR